MEQSFSSHGEARNIIGKGDDDDFDVVENTKQKSHRAIDTHTCKKKIVSFKKLSHIFLDHKNRDSLTIHDQHKQPNRASLTESASPSSGVIKNKTPEKEKVIEVKETRPHVQEQHYHHEVIHHEPEHNDHHEIIYHEEENNEPHEIIFHEENNDNHEIIFHNHDEQNEHHGHHERYEPEYVEEKHHHEPSYVQEKKIHKEEEPIYHPPKHGKIFSHKTNFLIIS